MGIVAGSRRANVDPGGMMAPDVIIEVNGVGVNTTYHIRLFDRFSSLSKSEKLRLRAFLRQGYDLDYVFRPAGNIQEVLREGSDERA